MPQSLSSVYLHAVFSTRERIPFLADESIRAKAHAMVLGVSNSLRCEGLVAGGVEDHIHLVARLGKSTTIADWLKEVKRQSSVQLKLDQPLFGWQAGYGVFSFSARDLELVIDYVRGQVEHHRVVSFQDEFRRLMTEHHVEWDERYVWG